MKKLAILSLVTCSALFTPGFALLRGWDSTSELPNDRRLDMSSSSKGAHKAGGSGMISADRLFLDKRRSGAGAHGIRVGMTMAMMMSSTMGMHPPASATRYTSKDGVFTVQLPLISEDILQGYASPSELRSALINVAKFTANIAIKEGATYVPFEDPPVMAPSEEMNNSGAPVPLPTTQEMASADGQAMGGASASGQTDFETNNQEEGVDEADAVKSDGTYVYAAYGDALVVWNAVSGEQITKVTMPPIPKDTSTGGFTDGGGPILADSIYFYPQHPSIRSLLLEVNRLVVIVDGYGYSKRAELNLSTPILYDLLGTHVRVYDTSDLSTSMNITLLKSFDISGFYQDARAVGENIHIVTTSSTDFWQSVYGPLQRYSGNFDDSLSADEYTAQAKELAQEKLIPAFVDQLLAEINMFGAPRLVAISLWESILSGMEESIFNGGVFQAYTQVTSFDVTDPTLTLSLAGSFMPNSWGFTYSTPDMLIFSVEGWNLLPERNATGPTTYFLGMKLEGATAIPAAIGSISGGLLNQYSLDIYDGNLRAATTIPALLRWPEVIDGSTEFPDPIMEFPSQNQIYILQIPVIGVGDVGIFSEVGRIANLGKEGESFTSIRFFDNVAYAVTFERTDPFYVLSLDVENPRVLGELEITGFSSYLHSINDDNTLIVGIGDEADMNGTVTGLKIALFDTTDPTNPTLLQSLTVEQDDDIWSSSSVSWDFKAFRYLPLQTPETGIVIIPVSVYAYYPATEGNFDGFLAFDVSRQGITRRGEISHVASDDFYSCYSNAYLPDRSLVFNGQVTTLKGHSVISTNLDSFQKNWEIQLDADIDQNNTETCYYWLF